MSRSHEEPLRCNNFQKLMPRRLLSSRLGYTNLLAVFSLWTFFLLFLENRPHLSRAVFAVRQNTHTQRKTCWGLWKRTSWAHWLISYRGHYRVIGWTTETIMQQLVSIYLSLIVSSICGLVQVRHNTQHSVHIVSTEMFSFSFCGGRVCFTSLYRCDFW